MRQTASSCQFFWTWRAVLALCIWLVVQLAIHSRPGHPIALSPLTPSQAGSTNQSTGSAQTPVTAEKNMFSAVRPPLAAGRKSGLLPRFFLPAALLILTALLLLMPSDIHAAHHGHQTHTQAPTAAITDAETAATKAGSQVVVTLYVMSQCPGELCIASLCHCNALHALTLPRDAHCVHHPLSLCAPTNKQQTPCFVKRR